MSWFWLNIPLAALIFLAMTLIPLWLVIKHPDTGPETPAAPVPAQAAHSAVAAASPAAARNGRAARQLELAGDSPR
jgi:hypothetical protein